MFKSFEPNTGSGGSNWRRACDRLHHQFQSSVEKSHLPLRTRLCQFGPSVWIFSILDDSDIHQMPMRTSSCPSQEVFHLLRPKERLWRLWPMEVQNALSFFQWSWIFFFSIFPVWHVSEILENLGSWEKKWLHSISRSRTSVGSQSGRSWSWRIWAGEIAGTPKSSAHFFTNWYLR